MAWVWDAPTGTYKDHALSAKIRDSAVADTQFMRFTDPEPGYGRGKGQSVTITRVGNLPLAGKVSEIQRLPEGRPPITTKQVPVSEWGYKTPLTELEGHLTHFDLRSKVQRALRDQMRLTLDKMIADAMKATLIKASIASSSVSIATDGTPDDTTDQNLDISVLREIHDYMRGTLKVPPFSNGKYVGIVSTKAARGLKGDDDFKDWNAPTNAQPLQEGIRGFLANIEGFAIYETNHFDALDNSIGTNGVAGEAVFFGMDASFLATVVDPELRIGLSEDLGRFRELGWYGILEAGLPWDTASESRVVHFTSDD